MEMRVDDYYTDDGSLLLGNSTENSKEEDDESIEDEDEDHNYVTDNPANVTTEDESEQSDYDKIPQLRHRKLSSPKKDNITEDKKDMGLESSSHLWGQFLSHVKDNEHGAEDVKKKEPQEESKTLLWKVWMTLISMRRWQKQMPILKRRYGIPGTKALPMIRNTLGVHQDL